MKERQQLEKKAEEEATLAHMLNMAQSELLSETTDATSVNGPWKVGKDRFKGFSEAQIRVIREEQLRQIEEKKCRDKNTKLFDQSWEDMSQRCAIATQLMDIELENRKR